MENRAGFNKAELTDYIPMQINILYAIIIEEETFSDAWCSVFLQNYCIPNRSLYIFSSHTSGPPLRTKLPLPLYMDTKAIKKIISGVAKDIFTLELVWIGMD